MISAVVLIEAGPMLIQWLQGKNTMNTLSQIQASFNGELSDYLLTLKDTEVQKEIFESYRAFNLKILVDYRFSIHHELISNQIIRYKDIQKIPENSLPCALHFVWDEC